MERQPLSDAERRAQYLEDGHTVVAEPVLPADVVVAARAGMEAVRQGRYDTGRPPQPSPWNPGDDPAALCKIEQPQFASAAIMDLVRHPALAALAAAVSGAEELVQAWWVQLLYKPRGESTETAPRHIGWHQDRNYWRVWEEGSELFTAWVALSDVTADSGPMRFVAGSHRWGLLDIADGGFHRQDLDGQVAGIPVPAGAAWNEVSCLLPPGGVSLHHCLTLHGSGANRGPGPRCSLAVHMRTERSRPVGGRREGLARFIDDPALCPVIWRA
jgi:ectoine hydroxylase-related dioxygenase (phytanoyl-CoA dioxygenase family)